MDPTELSLNEYQLAARTTAIYPDDMDVLYPLIELQGELGEVADKIKKVYRDNDGNFPATTREELKKELGDVCWPLAMLCSDLELSLEEVAKTNLDKLFSRQDRGTIQGSGDNR